MLKQMAKMPKFIEDFRARLRVEEQAAQERVSETKALQEEARDYFGFDIPVHDPRYEDLVARKEAEAQEQKKKVKKEAKLAFSEASILALQKKAQEEKEKLAENVSEKDETSQK